MVLQKSFQLSYSKDLFLVMQSMGDLSQLSTPNHSNPLTFKVGLKTPDFLIFIHKISIKEAQKHHSKIPNLNGSSLK
jgi:hypothetical protein